MHKADTKPGSAFAVLVFLCWATPSFGEAGPACKFLSVPELEAYFGGKPISVKGGDKICSIKINDVRHEASLIVNPPSPTDQVLSVQQRLDFVTQTMQKKGKPLESKIFGSVACYKSTSPLGDNPLPITTCFQSQGGYMSLTIASDDPEHATFEDVRALLDKAVARRK